MTTDFDITPAEWRLMRVIWTEGETTSAELIDFLDSRMDWKPATVKTLLRRLVKKGILGTRRQGRAFIYHPRVDEQETMNHAADRMFANFCAHRTGAVLEHALDKLTLSKSDIKSLQQILSQKAKSAPDQVKCNCMPGECKQH